MSDRLDGKIALITGATKGIGLATARLFAAQGAHVYITGRDAEVLKAAQDAIGANVNCIQADSTHLCDLDHVVEQIKDEAGRLDVLYANAGAGTLLPLGQITERQVDDTFALNVKALIFTVQKALPLLVAGSSVILAGSSASIAGTAAFSVYSASKAAVRNLARSWILDLKGTGIRINVLSPGPVRTPALLEYAGDDPAQQQGMIDYLGTLIPMGRVAEADEIAKAALFLASDDSSFINGAEIFADGGMAQV
jgi:NAD(P)-dependent dehydrogenase (short-subunit alcohol dehydrogenase family)